MRPTYRLLSSGQVRITGAFWVRYQQLVKNEVIPYQWAVLNDCMPGVEPSYTVHNFRIASGELPGQFHGLVFQDSDLYKWLEAVGNALQIQRDPALEEKADTIIGYIAAAQQEDGYLNTYYQLVEPDRKWTNVLECHELYCAGHFFEAAVSYYKATQKQAILEVARRLADHIADRFGPEESKLHGYPGHQEIELGLLRLYEVTGDERYRRLAAYFIDTRGTNRFFDEEYEQRGRYSHWTKTRDTMPNLHYSHLPYNHYNQFHQPVREQRVATGHAVRAVYMYAAMAELAALNGDEPLLRACEALWENIVQRQLYITGGIGSTNAGEAFTMDYDLPNDTAYAETCASIGLIFFAQKMLLNRVDHTFGDTLEQALYNTVLAGLSQDGKRFFYVNPLEMTPEVCAANPERHHVKSVRQDWYACACCPPNIARLITGLSRYVYTTARNTVYVHLYLENEAEIPLEGGAITLRQTTDYPWSGEVQLQVCADIPADVTLSLRIPGWCRAYTLTVNGEPIDVHTANNGHLSLTRRWGAADQICLSLSMEPVLLSANRNIHYNGGRVALARGPLVYCFEEADNGKYLNLLAIQPGEIEECPEENGAVSLLLNGRRDIPADSDQLYSQYTGATAPQKIKAIPYYLWNNRGAGEMAVWMRSL